MLQGTNHLQLHTVYKILTSATSTVYNKKLMPDLFQMTMKIVD